MSKDKEISFEVKVLLSWLENYSPNFLSGNGEDVIFLSSLEIQQKLVDLIDIPISDITQTMISEGYRVAESPDHRACWLLKKL